VSFGRTHGYVEKVMQRIKTSIERNAKRIAMAVMGAGALLVGVAGLDAQEGQDYLPKATIEEVMNLMIMPLTQELWDAVVYEDTIKGPETDEGWQKIRGAAVSLAEAANVLMIPGRPAAAPGAVAAEGELSPKEIEDLIATNRSAWVGYARGLHESAMQAMKAIDARNAEQLADVGGTLDAVCQGCHLQFWYPNQER
jgi:hypothetical protein